MIMDRTIIEIINERMNRRIPANIKKQEAEEFSKFVEDNSGNIIITKPDKTDTIVIMKLSSYFLMGLDIITRFNYTRIQPENIENILIYLRTLQYNVIKKFNEDLNLNSKTKVNIYDNFNFRYLYLLPKIHKDRNSWINDDTPPGRPIISCSGAIFKSLEIYIAKFFDGLIWKSKHWIRSAHDLVATLDRLNLDLTNCELFVADIKELYLNINIITLRDKINGFLGRHRITDAAIYSEAVYIDLCNVFFLFNDNLYKMSNGILMGAPFSPALAYIYLHEMDDEILIDNNIIYYARYIDDLFIIRKTGTTFNEDLLRPYGLVLGESNFGKSVTFLDLKLWICPIKQKIEYGTYFKTTNNFNYVRWDSDHSQSTKKGIVISQLIRISRTNSVEIIKHLLYEMIIRKFVKLGYGTNLLKKLKKKAFRIIQTQTCKNKQMGKKWQHIKTHRMFDRIMDDIRRLDYMNEDTRPNISTYNAWSINKHLSILNPATLASTIRKRFYKEPFGIENYRFDYTNNNNFLINYNPSVTIRNPHKVDRKRSNIQIRNRFQNIINTLEVEFRKFIPRKSIFCKQGGSRRTASIDWSL